MEATASFKDRAASASRSSKYLTGFDGRSGSFAREIRLTEGFFEHLSDHAVPLDENAIRQLRESLTALDLYTWLPARRGRPVPSSARTREAG